MNKNIKIILGVIGVGVASVLLFNLSNKSNTSNTSYKSYKPAVFSSSASPVILLGISVAEAASLPQGIALIESNITITGPRGERINEKVNLNLKPQENGEYGLVMNPKDEQSFTPGKYSLSANIQTKSGIRHIEQDFLWGVLAINPNKSVYRPGETANLALAVLDERGMMVCDAVVTLQVRKSESQKVTSLSTKDGSIRVNEECHQKKKTERPDYETEYTTRDPGIYQMTLTATTKNGTYTIEDYFEVRESVLFDIERITATRIYPVYEYPVIIKVTPEQDFKGTVTEVVPEFFGIKENRSDTSYMTYRTYRSDKTDTSDTTQVIEWTVDWKAGKTYELSYSYKSPEISPQFYLLGPLVLRQAQDDSSRIEVFREARQWQVAVDAIAYDTFSNNDTGSGTASTLSWSHTVTSSGSNRILIVGVHIRIGSGQTVSGITFNTTENFSKVNNDAVATNAVNVRTEMWYLLNPSTGTYTIEVTLSSAARFAGGATSYTGVDQTTSFGTTATATGNSTAPSVSVSGAVGDTIVDAVSHLHSASTLSVDGSQSEKYQEVTQSGTSGENVRAGGSTEAGAASVTMSWSISDARNWTIVGVAIKPASESNSPTITSVTDTPDPTNPGRSVSFVTDWNDADSGEVVKTKICKTNSLTSQNCDGGSWASSSAFTTSDPISLVYDIVGGDAGQTRSYYAFVCDDGGSCSTTVDGTTNGTFVVNSSSVVPNVKFR